MTGFDARKHLDALVGQTIYTAGRRQPNRILRLEGDAVIVATDRSPAGEPVPISEVQAAGDELFASGELRIHPDAIGYRSAFLGAALSLLPGVEIHDGPLRLVLADARFLMYQW